MRFRLLTMLVSPLLVVACHPPQAPPPPPPVNPIAVRAAVDSQFGRWRAALETRNATDLAAIYTTDGLVVAPAGSYTGRPAIEAMMKKTFAQAAAFADDTAVTEDFLLAGDHAVQAGHLTGTSASAGQKAAKIRIDFVFIWRKDADGVWRIGRDVGFSGVTR